MHTVRQRRLAVVAVLGALVVLVTAVVAASLGAESKASSAAGATVRVERRDLVTTESISGSLARSDTTTIVYGGTGSVQGAPGATGVALTGDVAIELAVHHASAFDVTTVATASGCTTSSTTTSSSTTSSSTTSNSTTSTTAAPTTTTTTTPCTTSSSTTAPPTTAPATTPSTPSTPSRPSNDAAPSGGTTTGDAGDSAIGNVETPSATITAIMAIGDTAARGSVLFRADDEPVVALVGGDALFRELNFGVDDGPDVRALEENLVALGYGDDLTVDESYDRATAAAIEAWETDLERASPDGVVSVGEVVFLAAPAIVLAHDAQVGDTVEAGSPVLTVGAESQIVEADIDATEVGNWTVGAAVELAWGDDETSTGTVIEISRDEVDGDVAMTITVAEQQPNRPIGSPVDVVRTTAKVEAVLAVPVAAVVETSHGTGAAVRVAAGGTDELVPVELGVVADGWVEITSGLDEGAEVRLPA